MASMFQEVYNKKDDCRWPINRFGTIVMDCSFQMRFVEEIQTESSDIHIVEIPEGTLLYHTTLLPNKTSEWWHTRYPQGGSRGMVWFTPTPEHGSMITGNYQLTYKTKKNIRLVFEQNIHSKHGTSNNKITGYQYAVILVGLIKKYDLNVSGYIGCNECEIALFTGDVKKSIELSPIKMTKLDMKFID